MYLSNTKNSVGGEPFSILAQSYVILTARKSIAKLRSKYFLYSSVVYLFQFIRT